MITDPRQGPPNTAHVDMRVVATAAQCRRRVNVRRPPASEAHTSSDSLGVILILVSNFALLVGFRGGSLFGGSACVGRGPLSRRFARSISRSAERGTYPLLRSGASPSRTPAAFRLTRLFGGAGIVVVGPLPTPASVGNARVTAVRHRCRVHRTLNSRNG